MRNASLHIETAENKRALAKPVAVALFWLYALFLAVAEILVATGEPLLGLIVHMGLALVLIYHGALGNPGNTNYP